MAQRKPLQTKHWLALLVTLFVIVLIAHLAIITSARGKFSTQKSEKISTFTTRMVELPMPTPVVEKTPEVVTPSKPVKPKTKVTAAPKEVPNPTPPPATQAAPVLLPIPVESVATAQPPAQQQPAVEVVPPAPEPSPATSVAALGDAGLPPPAFVALSSGQHTYKVIFTKSGVSNVGSAEVMWQQDGEKYTLNMLAIYTLLFKTFKVFEQNSTGQLTPQGLQPLRFSDKRLNKSEVAAHFNYELGKITFSANKPEVPLLAGAQDRVSVIWQIAGLLAAEPARYPPGSVLSMQTVSASDAEAWLFTVNESETLNLSTGSQIAQRLTRNPRREFDQKIELWFVPALNFLPARFRFTETNGDYVDAVWQRVQPLPNAQPR